MTHNKKSRPGCTPGLKDCRFSLYIPAVGDPNADQTLRAKGEVFSFKPCEVSKRRLHGTLCLRRLSVTIIIAIYEAKTYQNRIVRAVEGVVQYVYMVFYFKRAWVALGLHGDNTVHSTAPQAVQSRIHSSRAKLRKGVTCADYYIHTVSGP